MRYFSYLAVVVICEAARLPRGSDQTYFPNFQSIYHGNGATSYQNVRIGEPEIPHLEDYKTQDGNLDLGNAYDEDQPAGIQQNFVDHLAEDPFEEVTTNDLDLEHRHSLPQDYDRFNHEHDYEY
ncbi:uncharacterized protein LOC122396693 [Colletes gigas]|uniref:uncharacterized protein LOC122396693 n=1 Tax=Colletes gigas TaxID=935657 RepID=UPI001C9A31FD|nr:uncharacterized protein LOC122396693 [Colletes gigas]